MRSRQDLPAARELLLDFENVKAVLLRVREYLHYPADGQTRFMECRENVPLTAYAAPPVLLIR